MTSEVMEAMTLERYGRGVTTVSEQGRVHRREARPVGALLREWRNRRRLSQLELANRATVSTRHLSYVETGRSRPSREMVLHLADELDVPLDERNSLLVAAGYAPVYRETPIDAPEMEPVRRALDQILQGHEPYPAFVVDRRWELVSANAATFALLEGVAAPLVEPPVNVLRVALHPEGLAPRVVNFDGYSAHLLARLRRHVERTGDETLVALYDDVRSYPGVEEDPAAFEARTAASDVVLPMRLRTPAGELSFFGTIATFGTAVDVTLDDLAIEAFFPADEHTAEVLRRRA